MINVFHDDGDWAVWIDPEEMPRTGGCIGVDHTLDGALKAAITELEDHIKVLKNWPAEALARELSKD